MRLAADRDVHFAVANTDTAAGCRLHVAVCVAPMAFSVKGVEREVRAAAAAAAVAT